MASPWRDASADAHRLLPREAPGKVGTMAANVAERGYTKGTSAREQASAFADGPSTLIGEFITLQALSKMPVFSKSGMALDTYFAAANAVLRRVYSQQVDIPEEGEEPAIPVSGGDLLQVQQLLDQIEVPSHDLSARVPMSELDIRGAQGSVERVTNMILALSNAHRRAAESCGQELAQAQGLIGQLEADLARAQQGTTGTGDALAQSGALLRQVQDNPEVVLTNPAVLPDLLGAQTAAATSNDQTEEALGDSQHEVVQLAEQVKEVRQQLNEGSTPETGTHEYDVAWIAAMNGSIADDDTFLPADLQKFVPGVGAVTSVNDQGAVQAISLLQDADDLRETGALAKLKDLQAFAVVRAGRYAEAKSLPSESSTDTILDAAQKMAKALRLLYLLVSNMTIKAPAWGLLGAPLTDRVLRTMLMVEYRLQYAIATGRSALEEMPTAIKKQVWEGTDEEGRWVELGSEPHTFSI